MHAIQAPQPSIGRALVQRLPILLAAGAFLFSTAMAVPATQGVKSPTFRGSKADKGSVSASFQGEELQLTLSDDFVVPDTPAPHWQVVDSMGRAHLLQRLVVKGDKLNKTITVPRTVPDLAKVQIWCAWAEVLLGETTLELARPNGAHTSTDFRGPKANKGRVVHTMKGGKGLLALSDDFVVPDTPAPHWQIVDAAGNSYLLQRLVVKGDKLNKMIEVPDFVRDIAKVQIWCAWAETVLGEASFRTPLP